MKNLKGILENYFGKVVFALSLLAVEVKVFKPLFHLYYGDEFLFPERVAATSGIMVGKYPETPGKLSTLSTMLYKQIVYKLLSLGKSEVDKL